MSRDCTERTGRNFANVQCRQFNCGQEGHMSRDCTERRNLANVQCWQFNCNGHGNLAIALREAAPVVAMRLGGSRLGTAPSRTSGQCRNCDEYGHMNKDCPKPRDSSDEYGHTNKDCPKPRDNCEIAQSHATTTSTATRTRTARSHATATTNTDT